MYQIGWFSTGRDKAARDLLVTVENSIGRGEIRAGISFVFSNHEPAEAAESDSFFRLVESYHIPLICFSHRKLQSQKGKQTGWRLEYDREVMKLLSGFVPDLCVLAGYMLIVGEEMCQKYPMINLHPAAPGGPSGTWQEVIWKLIEGKARQSGVMMHLVTPELDKGPVVTYGTFPLRVEPFNRLWEQIKNRSVAQIKAMEGENNPLFKLIRQQGLAREFPLIVATLKAFSEGKVKNKAGEVIDAQGKPSQGYNLTAEIEQKVLECRTK